MFVCVGLDVDSSMVRSFDRLLFSVVICIFLLDYFRITRRCMLRN